MPDAGNSVQAQLVPWTCRLFKRRRDYNDVRPHSSLKGATPREYDEISRWTVVRGAPIPSKVRALEGIMGDKGGKSVKKPKQKKVSKHEELMKKK